MQPGGRPNAFHLFCFAPRFAPPGAPLSPEGAQHCEVRHLPRAADPRWFDGFRSGSLRALARSALADLSALDAAAEVVVVIAQRPDAADLTHLQAAWAFAQDAVGRGATVVLDAQSNRFWCGAEVADWPANRPFALSSEVNIVVEAEERSGAASAVHTRGLAKFGRPDLVAFDVPSGEWDATAALLRVAAMRLALGAVLRPGDSMPIDGGSVHFSQYETDPLHLNNEALLVSISAAAGP